MLSAVSCRIIGLLAIGVLASCGDGSSGEGDTAHPVVTGPIHGVPEAEGHWNWGDENATLCQQWFLSNSTSGWFSGTDYPALSNVDVYVALDAPDPLFEADASRYHYSTAPQRANLGDTVFFRSVDGFYGAWSLTFIDDQNRLYGTWYFQPDGSADFTGGTTAVDESPTDGPGCFGQG